MGHEVKTVYLARYDYINIIFMFISCAIAYVIPWQLLLFAYAVLGPLHYLTQISWMHDRKYFTQRKYDYLYLLGLIVVILFLSVSYEKISLGLLALALGLSGAFVFCKTLKARITIIFAVVILVPVFITNRYMLLFLFLVPTIIHVYFFTAGFILNGAFKHNSMPGYLSFFILLACGLSFFVMTPSQVIQDSIFFQQNIHYFMNIAEKIMHDFGVNNTNQSILNMMRFIAFAYTYHYLNWFLKTGIIRWHQISANRIILISVLYLFFVSLYFYNYSLGFAAVLILSFAHVVLEFPLDILMLKNIGQVMFNKL